MLHSILIFGIFCSLITSACAPGIEFSKTIWGSSTRALEEARVNAIVKTYNQPLSECYDQVLQVIKEQGYTIYIQNKSKATIVVLGIKGAVDTTEVGIFFSDLTDQETKIFVSSLSSNAKRIVANVLFPKLDQIFALNAQQSQNSSQ